jgi:hypothetical protein
MCDAVCQQCADTLSISNNCTLDAGHSGDHQCSNNHTWANEIQAVAEQPQTAAPVTADSTRGGDSSPQSTAAEQPPRKPPEIGEDVAMGDAAELPDVA